MCVFKYIHIISPGPASSRCGGATPRDATILATAYLYMYIFTCIYVFNHLGIYLRIYMFNCVYIDHRTWAGEFPLWRGDAKRGDDFSDGFFVRGQDGRRVDAPDGGEHQLREHWLELAAWVGRHDFLRLWLVKELAPGTAPEGGGYKRGTLTHTVHVYIFN